MIDHIGRWVCWQTWLYPASGVAVTTVQVGSWTWKRCRRLRRGEYA